jgi:hypothetical protein
MKDYFFNLLKGLAFFSCIALFFILIYFCAFFANQYPMAAAIMFLLLIVPLVGGFVE